MGEPEEENIFADIDEYIDDTNAIVLPRVDASTFKVEHNLILTLKAEGFFEIPQMMTRHNISEMFWVCVRCTSKITSQMMH